MNFNEAIDILGLSSKYYTEKELKRAYYKNAIKWHPDKNGGCDERQYENPQQLSNSIVREREPSLLRTSVNKIIK